MKQNLIRWCTLAVLGYYRLASAARSRKQNTMPAVVGLAFQSHMCCHEYQVGRSDTTIKRIDLGECDREVFPAMTEVHDVLSRKDRYLHSANTAPM